MRHNSKLAQRKAAYENLVAQTGTLPTLDELAEAWECSRINVAAYRTNNKGQFPIRRKYRTRESYEETYQKRLQIYQHLSAMLYRPPTYRELAVAWGVEKRTVRSYLGYLTRRGRPLAVSVYLRQIEQIGRVRRTLPSVITQIRSRHNINPSASELALLYGVSKQRLTQIIDAFLAEDEAVQVRDGRPIIRWDVEIPE